MKRAAWLIVVAAAASAAAWLGASELAAPARAATVVLVGVLPLLLAAQAGIDPSALREAPVEAAYFSSMVLIWIIGAAAAWAGIASGFSTSEMSLVPLGFVQAAVWIGAATLAAFAIALIGRRLGWRESEMLEWLLPESLRERALFVVLSISAGIGEELAYRAFLIPALVRASGSVALAVVVSSVAFGMMHGYQQSSGAVRASLLGALLAVPMLVTGSVIPSMATHALYDILAGLVLTDWLVPGRARPRRSDRLEH